MLQDVFLFEGTIKSNIVLHEDSFTDEEVASLLSGSAEDPARALVDAANAAGGKDNITAVVVKFP